MAFDINTDSSAAGDFLPVFKWSATAGVAAIRRSVKNDKGSWDKSEDDVALPLKLIFDFDSAEQGWVRIAGGVDFKMAKLGQPKPAQPSPEHKLGFRVQVYGKQIGLAAFSHTAKCVIAEMNTLHDAYLADKAKHAGKLPVVEIKSVKKIESQTKEGAKTYRVPVWSITAWVDRPAEMQAKIAEAAKAAETASAALDDDIAF